MEMMSKPAGYDELLQAVEAFKQKQPTMCSLGYIDLSDGEVILKEKIESKAVKQASIYATTPDQLKLSQFASFVKEKAGELFETGRIKDVGYPVSKLFTAPADSSVNQVPTINYDGIHQFDVM